MLAPTIPTSFEWHNVQENLLYFDRWAVHNGGKNKPKDKWYALNMDRKLFVQAIWNGSNLNLTTAKGLDNCGKNMDITMGKFLIHVNFQPL